MTTADCEIYQKAIDILTSQGKFHINLGIERVERILDLLKKSAYCRRAGMPDLLSQLKFIHVAGTNGKGSVCAVLSSILTKSELVGRAYLPDNDKFKVGLFTSPHIFEYTERIKINDVEIDKDVFAQKVIDITELAQKNDIHLTEFEILTVVAFEYFAENAVDIVVLETGLGGRLDATNVIAENLCSIITHIDLDHTERLGDTVEKIAFEKAGIIKKNCPVIISENNLGIKVIKQVAEEKNSPFFLAKEAPNFPKENLALKGQYQAENLALALSAIKVLKEKGFAITKESIDKGLKNVKHPCRFEYLPHENIIVDGAHNPNGTKALRESLDFYYPNQRIKFIFGCLNNKKYAEMMNNLFKNKDNDEIYFYHFDNKNSCTYEELASACEFEAKPFNEFKKESKTLTVICGSFYMIKELLSKMGIK